VDGPEGTVQTAAFEIEGDVIRALYVVRNPDKLRHLAAELSRGTVEDERPVKFKIRVSECNDR
jgi:hypothetical protein